MTNGTADSFYKTSDLNLAGVISVSGYLPERIEKLNEVRSAFVFRNTPELAEIVNAYWRGEARVEPQAYWAQIKALKARLYQS